MKIGVLKEREPENRVTILPEHNAHVRKLNLEIYTKKKFVDNTAAENEPSTPIYGMPIIKAHTAKNIIVLKRGMGKRYAGIENSLFFDDKTGMLYGNSKDSFQKLVTEIKSL